MIEADSPSADLPSHRVDPERLWDRHMKLAEFGATPAGGVNRQALSQAEIAARAVLVAWAHEAGLQARHDSVANLFFRLEGREPDADPVLSGSHIDSQPSGGKFDGSFGVLAALEAVTAMAKSNMRPHRPIEVVAWTNEEGSRFSPGMMGSEAFVGLRPLDDILAVTDAEGVVVRDAVARVLAADSGVATGPLGFPIHAFVEAHIEQGTALEGDGPPIGVVSGMQGSRRFRVTVTGEASHAGTTPRTERKDAVLAAARMLNALATLMAKPKELMFTVGMFQVRPNAPSVVPMLAYFSIDLRHQDNTVLSRLGDAIADCCAGERGPCTVVVREIANSPSLDFPTTVRRRIGDAADRLGIGWREIYSFAGHDARQLHYHCDSGMIFVPCRDGISHNEAEWAEPDHLAAGARVLADALWDLANES